MGRIGTSFLLLGLLSAAAATQDKKDRGKTPELTKKYVECMQSNKAEMKGLHEDIEKDKPEADLKKRLAKIRENVIRARDLKYRREDEEAEKLEGHFEIFLLKLKLDFEDVEWGGREKRLFLHERIQAKCDVCHETLRD
jgi:hypothetical protein